MKKRNLSAVVLFLFFSCVSVLAQELKVKSFERLEWDLLARTEERLDLNEEPCAIIRVSVPNSKDFVFEGNIIGTPQHTPGEVLIWMTKGSKTITIKSEKTGSIKFNFPEKLERQVVYKLTLIHPENIQMFRLDFAPTDAKVYINDTLRTALNGSLSMVLKEGKHRYRIERKHHITEEGEFDMHSNHATVLTKSLKPNYGIVNVTSNRTAKITIGDNIYKNTKHASDTLVAGKHQIVVQKQQLKKTVNIVTEEGKSQNIEIKFRPDIFILGNYSIYKCYQGGSFNGAKNIANLYGLTLGFCKNHGGYVSYKMGEYDLYYDSEKSSFIKIHISGGYLARINNWLYAQVGMGYGLDKLKRKNPEYEYYVSSKIDQVQLEGGTMFRLGKRTLLTMNYSVGLSDWFGTSTYTCGLGFVL